MSEIKGQILGVVLVLAIFAVVASALYGAFQESATTVAGNITGADTYPKATAVEKINNDNSLLTF